MPVLAASSSPSDRTYSVAIGVILAFAGLEILAIAIHFGAEHRAQRVTLPSVKAPVPAAVERFARSRRRLGRHHRLLSQRRDATGRLARLGRRLRHPRISNRHRDGSCRRPAQDRPHRRGHLAPERVLVRIEPSSRHRPPPRRSAGRPPPPAAADRPGRGPTCRRRCAAPRCPRPRRCRSGWHP